MYEQKFISSYYANSISTFGIINKKKEQKIGRTTKSILFIYYLPCSLKDNFVLLRSLMQHAEDPLFQAFSLIYDTIPFMSCRDVEGNATLAKNETC